MKHLLLLLLLATTVVTNAQVALNNAKDVNDDNQVNIGDVNIELNSILEDSSPYFLDVNGDGSVNVGDVNSMLVHIISTPEPDENTAAAAALFTKCYANFAVGGDGGMNGGCWVDGFDSGTSGLYRQLWNLNELTTDEAICCWNDLGLPELNSNNFTSMIPQLAGYWFRLYLGIDFCNQYLTTYGDLDAGMSAEVRLLRALNYMLLLDTWGNVPVTTTPGDKTPTQYKSAEVFAFIESELLATIDDLGEPAPKTSRDEGYGRVDKAAAWLLLSRLYLNAEVYTGTPKWNEAATYARLVIKSPYALSTTASDRQVEYDGSTSTWHYSAYQKLFIGDNDRTDAAHEAIMPLIHDSHKTFWTSWGTSMYLMAPTYDGNMCEHPTFNIYGNGIGQNWAGNRARPDLVRKFFPEADYPEANLPKAYSRDNAKIAGDDRALLSSMDRTLNNTDIATFSNGWAEAKFNNFSTDGSLENAHNNIPDADVFLLRKAEAYLTLAEALTRMGGGITDGEACNAINELRTRANAQTKRSYSLREILDEWGREFHFEGRRRSDLIRFGCYGGNNDYMWQWKGGVIEGKAFPAEYNLFPIPAMAMSQNPNLTQNQGYAYTIPSTFELRVEPLLPVAIDLATEPVITFDWDRPDYNNDGVHPVYTLLMSTDPTFESNTVSLGRSSELNYEVSPQRVNQLLHTITASNTITTIYVRCDATYETSYVSSNAVSLSVQPYAVPVSEQWYIIGSNIGINPWYNSADDVGTGLLPLYPTSDNTLTYTALMREGEMFKLVRTPGDWNDQLDSWAWVELCDGIWIDYDMQMQFMVSTTGVYTITMTTNNSLAPHVAIEATTITPGALASVSLTGAASATLQPTRSTDNHDWWAPVSLDSDGALSLVLTGKTVSTVGGEGFPYGTTTAGSTGISAKAGDYIVFYNDITGQYNFYTRDAGAGVSAFYITEVEPIDLSQCGASGYRLFVPHVFEGEYVSQFKVELKMGDAKATVTANSNGYVDATSLKSALSSLVTLPGDYTLDITVSVAAKGKMSGKLTLKAHAVDTAYKTTSGKAMTPVSAGVYEVELEEGESWQIVGVNNGITYGPVDDKNLTCAEPPVGTAETDCRLIVDVNSMTYRTVDLSGEYFPTYIYLAGIHNGWGSPRASALYNENDSGRYLGFSYLNGGFKFRSHETTWDQPDWGSDGSDYGLKEFGTDLSAPEGYYAIHADLSLMTWWMDPITTIGLIGMFDDNMWSSDYAKLEYNATTGAWEGTATIPAGVEFKFRANDDWTINWGGTFNNLEQNGYNLKVAEGGTYFVQLFLECPTRDHVTFTKQ